MTCKSQDDISVTQHYSYATYNWINITQDMTGMAQNEGSITQNLTFGNQTLTNASQI